MQGRMIHLVPHVHFNLARVNQEVGGLERASPHTQVQCCIAHPGGLFEVIDDLGAWEYSPEGQEKGRNWPGWQFLPRPCSKFSPRCSLVILEDTSMQETVLLG